MPYTEIETRVLNEEGDCGGGQPALSTCRTYLAAKNSNLEWLTARRIAEYGFSQSLHGEQLFYNIGARAREAFDGKVIGGAVRFPKSELIAWFCDEDRGRSRLLRSKQAAMLFNALVNRRECPATHDRFTVRDVILKIDRMSCKRVDQAINALQRFNDSNGEVEVHPKLKRHMKVLFNCSRKDLYDAAVNVLGAPRGERKIADPIDLRPHDNGHRAEIVPEIEEPPVVVRLEAPLELPMAKSEPIVVAKTSFKVPRRTLLVAAMVVCFSLLGTGAAAYRNTIWNLIADFGPYIAAEQAKAEPPKTVAERLDAAYAIFRTGDLDIARRKLFGILSEKTDRHHDAIAYLYLSYIDIFQRNYHSAKAFLDEAEKQFRGSIKASSDPVKSQRWLSLYLQRVEKERLRIAIRTNHFVEAEEALEKGTQHAELAGESNTLLFLKWELLMHQGRFSKAIEAIQDYPITSMDSRIDKNLTLAMAYAAQGNFERGTILNQAALTQAVNANSQHHIMMAYCNMVFYNQRRDIPSDDLVSTLKEYIEKGHDAEVEARLNLALKDFSNY